VEVEGEEERAARSGRRLPAQGLEGSFRVERAGTLLGVYRDGAGGARAEVVLCAG
jgi:tRNA pseudouridine55 synthase